jgi:UTP--glucose-1-phosphate uridylyltransferase
VRSIGQDAKVTKAIIAVAGYGSRMLPITKSIEKCMLPIVNRPIVDYIVEDCISAGIKEIIFVVGEHSQQLKDYYSTNPHLEKYLIDQNKQQFMDCIQPPENIKFRYVTQNTDEKYGTAIPVAVAADFIQDQEQILMIAGDDFLWSNKKENDILGLVNSAIDHNDAALIGVPIDKSLVSSYGVIQKDGDGLFMDIVEKPAIDKAPSNLINVSKYVLPKSLISQIINYCKRQIHGEYIIVDPINEWVSQGGKMHVYNAKGTFLDGGNPKAWLEANNFVSSNS